MLTLFLFLEETGSLQNFWYSGSYNLSTPSSTVSSEPGMEELVCRCIPGGWAPLGLWISALCPVGVFCAFAVKSGFFDGGSYKVSAGRRVRSTM